MQNVGFLMTRLKCCCRKLNSYPGAGLIPSRRKNKDTFQDIQMIRGEHSGLAVCAFATVVRKRH